MTKMGEPERKRKKCYPEENVNPGPGPPIRALNSHEPKCSEFENSRLFWERFQTSIENLNNCLITRCVCPWELTDYQDILINSIFNCCEEENSSKILLFCSTIQLLCEEIARQNSVVNRSNGYCHTLRRLKVLLFHVNSESDPTCPLQNFIRSPNQYVSYAAARALSAWLKAADEGACRVLLDRLLENIVSQNITFLCLMGCVY